MYEDKILVHTEMLSLTLAHVFLHKKSSTFFSLQDLSIVCTEDIVEFLCANRLCLVYFH